MRIYANPVHAVLNQPVCVDVAMEKGEGVLLHWNFDSGGWETIRDRTGTKLCHLTRILTWSFSLSDTICKSINEFKTWTHMT